MGFGKGFWPSLWLVQGVVEVFLKPGLAIAWIFLAVASVYWTMKILPNMPGGKGRLMTVLTAALWIVSCFFLL